MPLALINGKLLYFAHIPKTGGTSIERYLRSKGRLVLVSTKRGGWAMTSPQHMTAEIAERWVPSDTVDAAFTVMRNPMDRLLSAFKMRVKPGDNGRRARMQFYLREPLTALKRDRPIYSAHFGTAGGQQLTSLDRWVRTVVSHQKRANPFLFDNHIRPQVDFLSPGQKVFQFEDGLEQVFRWIDEVTGTGPEEMPHALRSQKLSISVSSETKAFVEQAYAADYAAIAELESPVQATAGAVQ